MASEFAVGYNAMALTISTYLLFTAFIQLIAGPASDHYGRKPIVLIGLLIFGLSSLGCAYAKSYEAFFLWRALQAAVATAGVLSRAIVGDIFTPQRSAGVTGVYCYGNECCSDIWTDDRRRHGDARLACQLLFLCTMRLGSHFAGFFSLAETTSVRKKSMKALVRSYFDLCSSALFWAYSMVMACGIGGFSCLSLEFRS